MLAILADVFIGGKKIPTELRKDAEELKDSSLYDDVERSGEFLNVV